MCVNNVAVGLLLTTSSDFPLGSAASAAAEQPAQKELNRTDGSVAAWTNVERKVVGSWRETHSAALGCFSSAAACLRGLRHITYHEIQTRIGSLTATLRLSRSPKFAVSIDVLIIWAI